MKRHQWKWLVALWILGGTAIADEQPASPEAVSPPAAAGAETRQWLDNQRQGRQASPKAQPLSGPVQEQVHERYRKSFSHPIPQRFDREELGAGTASR
ncbi:MAG TPA: DUF3613 domain-containing protein [Rhodocyclaceae bacterium]|nr:DUF3613 domain-containing protein [Rhodocyclaceae bacterium]